MSTYAAPLRDMLFTMKEVGGLDAICAQPGHEETTPDLVEAILQEAAHYATGGEVHGAGPAARDHGLQEAALECVAAMVRNGFHRAQREHLAQAEREVGRLPHLQHGCGHHLGQLLRERLERHARCHRMGRPGAPCAGPR